MRLATVLLACLLLNGCLYQGAAVGVDEQQLESEPGAVSVRVPLVRQLGDKDCGAAAVASILQFWGERVTQAEIRRATRTPPDQPIAAGSLQEYLSRRGYENFLVKGTLGDLRNELKTGRPVLVGMLKPYVGKQWLAHYEVVTGISPRHVYTMNPGSGLERYPTEGFEREWQGSKRLTLVIAPKSRPDQQGPDQQPAPTAAVTY